MEIETGNRGHKEPGNPHGGNMESTLVTPEQAERAFMAFLEKASKGEKKCKKAGRKGEDGGTFESKV